MAGALVRATVAVALLTACSGGSDLPELSPAEVERLVQGPHPPHLYDTNSDAVRAEYGVIAGAIRLSSASAYDAAAVLPTDRDAPLVFYCATSWCSAARVAARRARAAGYPRVSLLRDGIRGWTEAGNPTSQP